MNSPKRSIETATLAGDERISTPIGDSTKGTLTAQTFPNRNLTDRR